VKKECRIVVNSTMAQMLVAKVRVEQDHGFRMRARWPLPSEAVSDMPFVCVGLLTALLCSSVLGSMAGSHCEFISRTGVRLVSLLILRSCGRFTASFSSRAVSLSRALLLSLLLSRRSGAVEAGREALSSSPEPDGRLLIETL
jgi:branched-subunit amino acid transport protein